MDPKNINTALIGSLLGLIPLLVSALINWLEKRSRVARKEEALDFAQRQVAFISAWLQARQLSEPAQKLGGIKKMVSTELDDIKSQVDQAMDIPHVKPLVKTDDRNFFQRLFLFYPPHTAGGWVYRGLFFMNVGAMILLLIVAASSPDTDTLVGFGLLIMPFLLLAILFHALAIHSDKAAEKFLLPSTKR